MSKTLERPIFVDKSKCKTVERAISHTPPRVLRGHFKKKSIGQPILVEVAHYLPDAEGKGLVLKSKADTVMIPSKIIDSKYRRSTLPRIKRCRSCPSQKELLEVDGAGFIHVPISVTVSKVVDDGSIHSLLKRKTKGEKHEQLLHKLTYNDLDINQRKEDGMTPLHIAAEMGDEACAKVLIAFSADINAVNDHNETPLDLAVEEPVKQLLEMLQAQRGCEVVRRFSLSISKRNLNHSTFVESINQRHNTCKNLNDYILKKRQKKLYEQLERNLNQRPSVDSWDESMAVAMQEKEIRKYKGTGGGKKLEPNDGSKFQLKGGSRLLFLDGGGMKGLAQIEILCQIEKKTGRKITELFDWIVGTSTGAIIALGLVYGNKSLSELRRLYYRLKEEIFTRAGQTKISKAFEEVLKEILGSEILMNQVSHPKVLIAAVNKQTTTPMLHFFNNCFSDEFSEQLVWKVARYTSAHPLVFSECDNYVDGGVLANNPCDYGMTAIQSFYREHGVKLPIALVVSLGTGIYPAEKLGRVNAHKILSFGKHWLNPDKLLKQAQNLISLLANALVESEIVAKNCRSRCEEQKIPFYRFSPHLHDGIQGLTVEDDKLLNMVIQAKIQAKEQGMDELIDMFRTIADFSAHINK